MFFFLNFFCICIFSYWPIYLTSVIFPTFEWSSAFALHHTHSCSWRCEVYCSHDVWEFCSVETHKHWKVFGAMKIFKFFSCCEFSIVIGIHIKFVWCFSIFYNFFEYCKVHLNWLISWTLHRQASRQKW